MTSFHQPNSDEERKKSERTNALAQKLFPASHPYPLPQKIGRFHIQGCFAQGGMSVLYLAVDPSTQEQVIVKVLRSKLLTDHESVQQFLNEANVISATNHPNIVKLYEYGEWEGGLYIAMELVKGQSLRRILLHNPLPLKRAIDVLLQISYALWHLHSLGIVHGDLKPENILLTDQGLVKVIDFGISKVLTHSAIPPPEQSWTTFKGTPIYMSPELLKDPTLYSFQSDIYSLAIVAYELVLGKITHGKVILTLAPRGIQQILQKGLQQNPAHRYTSIQEMIQDLSQYTHSGAITKDRQGSDYFFEMFDELEGEQKRAMASFFPEKVSGWTLGIATSFGVGVKSLFYLFEEHTDTLLFYSCSTKTKGVKGLTQLLQIQSIWKALSTISENNLPPFERGKKLFDELQRQSIDLAQATIALFDTASCSYRILSSQWTTCFFLSPAASREDVPLTPHPTTTFRALSWKKEEGSAPYAELSGTFSLDEEIFISCCTPSTILEFPALPHIPFDVMLSNMLHNSSSIATEKKPENILQTLRLHGGCVMEDEPGIFVALKPLKNR